MKTFKPPTERTWMNLGATRDEARRLLTIPPVPVSHDQAVAALYSGSASNMWQCAIRWMDHGCVVVMDDNMFYRGIKQPQSADAVDPVNRITTG